jgi:hypothetical protein
MTLYVLVRCECERGSQQSSTRVSNSGVLYAHSRIIVPWSNMAPFGLPVLPLV